MYCFRTAVHKRLSFRPRREHRSEDDGKINFVLLYERVDVYTMLLQSQWGRICDCDQSGLFPGAQIERSGLFHFFSIPTTDVNPFPSSISKSKKKIPEKDLLYNASNVILLTEMNKTRENKMTKGKKQRKSKHPMGYKVKGIRHEKTFTAEELANDPSLRWCPYRTWELLRSDEHAEPVRFLRYSGDNAELAVVGDHFMRELGTVPVCSIRRI